MPAGPGCFHAHWNVCACLWSMSTSTVGLREWNVWACVVRQQQSWIFEVESGVGALDWLPFITDKEKIVTDEEGSEILDIFDFVPRQGPEISRISGFGARTVSSGTSLSRLRQPVLVKTKILKHG